MNLGHSGHCHSFQCVWLQLGRKERHPSLLTEMPCRYKIKVPNLRPFRAEKVSECILQRCVAHCTQCKDLTFTVFLHLDWTIDEKEDAERESEREREDTCRVGKVATKWTKWQKEAWFWKFHSHGMSQVHVVILNLGSFPLFPDPFRFSHFGKNLFHFFYFPRIDGQLAELDMRNEHDNCCSLFKEK